MTQVGRTAAVCESFFVVYYIEKTRPTGVRMRRVKVATLLDINFISNDFKIGGNLLAEYWPKVLREYTYSSAAFGYQ